MAEIKCDDCKGKGHTTALIAGDVHIVECKECLGWGTLTIAKVQKNTAYGKFAGGRFGQIDDIDLTKLDKKSAYPATVNIDALLAE